MRSASLALLLLLATARPSAAAPACAEAALAAAPDAWTVDRSATGDFTLDGSTDVAFWRADSAAVIVYIVSCEQDRVTRAWRLRIPLGDGVPADQALVETGSLLIDDELVKRACGPSEHDQCEHVRQENRRRQALADAGGRALRVRAPTWSGWRLFWSPEMGGFIRIPG